MKEKKISKEQVLEDIRKASEKTEGTLTLRKFKKHVDYTDPVVYSRFESFTTAKEEAGIDDDFIRNSKLTVQGAGGATTYLGANNYKKLARQKGFDPDNDTLFLKLVEMENGKITHEITDKAFRKQD